MSAALGVIRIVESAGGRFVVDGERLGIFPKDAAAPVLEELRKHKLEIIDLIHRREVERDDRLRKFFVWWFDARIWLDTEAIALHKPNPRWWSGVTALHRACCRWILEHNQVVPPTSDEFILLLRELSCDIRAIHGEQMVMNVCQTEDVDAVEAYRSVNAGGKSEGD
jgi:hypothetical protein